MKSMGESLCHKEKSEGADVKEEEKGRDNNFGGANLFVRSRRI